MRKTNGSKMMESYKGGGDVPEEELLGLSQVPLGNDSAGAGRPLFLSDRGPVLDAGSGFFYPETSFCSAQEAQTVVEVSASGTGPRPINRASI